MRKVSYLFYCLIGLLFFSPQLVAAQSDVDARRTQLEAELAAEERAIAEQIKLLQQKQRETATVAGELNLLKQQIARAQASIKAKQLAIGRLDGDITARQRRITDLEARIEDEQSSLAELLRQTRDTDTVSLVEVMLDNRQLSEVFGNVDSFELVQKALHRSFAELRTAQEVAAAEREVLEDRKNQELDAQKTIEAERKEIAKREAAKQNLLSITKNQEQAYQKVLEERRRRAGQIRAALFALRDTAAIPFGEALGYALAAQKQTGIRPAFLLAILTQESNLGENVGTCNRPGDPPSKKWRAIMPGPGDKSSRDDESAFLRLTRELGLDPEVMPLSCPWRGGWGGAMGPSQFIPTTWEMYQAKVGRLLGKSVPNPWEPPDAFMASAVYLSELGASRGTYSTEREAALRYYAGGNWAKPANAFYGNQVMAKAEDIQTTMIDPLQNI